MRTVIIGGTGHIGTFLVPRLVEAGHEVISVSRGDMKPYIEHSAWEHVKKVKIDRDKAEAEGIFGQKILELQPDVVFDMICFTRKSAQQLVEALKGNIGHYLVCGSIWQHGHSVVVPTKEEESRNPFGEYGINKAEIEDYLLNEHKKNGFPATIIQAGHIVGPRWIPLNPLGNFNPKIFSILAKGEELLLPTYGMETLHHVHVDDLAQIFFKAMINRNAAIGESFHAVSERAVTIRGYAETVASWFGQKANLKFMAGDAWKAGLTELDISRSMDHILHSPNCSIEKAKRLLDYKPRYSSFQAIYEAVEWMKEEGLIEY